MVPVPPTPLPRRRFRRRRIAPTIRRFLSFESILMHHYCDACGHSGIDGKPLTIARYWIKTPSGDLYLCAHHFRKHRAHCAENAYETYEVT